MQETKPYDLLKVGMSVEIKAPIEGIMRMYIDKFERIDAIEKCGYEIVKIFSKEGAIIWKKQK